MAPAFSSVRHAAGFTLLLLVLLILPTAVARTGVLDRSQVYESVPVAAGPFAYIQRQIFEERSDVDIAFIGSSFMWAAIDAPYVQQELTRALGRQATVATLASVWPGLDRDYALLYDLVSQRRVRMVVLKFPSRELPTDDPFAPVNRVTDTPHIQAFRFFRVGELPGMEAGMPARGRASLYAGAVLGMPRHLLSLLRPNYIGPASATDSLLGGRIDQRGYFGASYVDWKPTPPVIAPDEMIYTKAPESTFHFYAEPAPEYQTHFVRRIGLLLKERGIPLVILYIPKANERRAPAVEERERWVDYPEISATMVGLPPAQMFGGFTDDEVKRFFSSDHFNDNGRFYFTRVMTPALVQVFLGHETAR